MIRPTERHRLYLMIAAVAASVFLFACGAKDAVTPQRAAAPGRPAQARPAEASASSLPGTPEPPAAVAAPAEATATAAVEPTPAGTEDSGAPAARHNEPEPRSLPAAPAGLSGSGRVFTNKDLERYRHVKEEFGLRDDVVVVDLTKPTPRDVTEKTTGGMTAAERDAELALAREKIDGLMRDLDHERKRILPLENPFVPAPQLSDQDKVAEAGMNNKERLDRVKQRIAGIEAEIGTLQRRIAELQSLKPSDEPAGGTDNPAPERE